MQQNVLAEYHAFSLVSQAEDYLKKFAENSGLTPRETEFLEALIMTDTDVEGIARSFGLTARTVHRHISNIYEKTGTGS